MLLLNVESSILIRSSSFYLAKKVMMLNGNGEFTSELIEHKIVQLLYFK